MVRKQNFSSTSFINESATDPLRPQFHGVFLVEKESFLDGAEGISTLTRFTLDGSTTF